MSVPLRAAALLAIGKTFYDGGVPDSLPGCERISSCLVRLPLYYNMTDAEQDYVIEQTALWLKKA